MTLEIFFYSFMAIALGFGIPLIITTTKIEKAVKPIADADRWLRERGLQELVKSLSSQNVHHSLPPEMAQRRDWLIQKARQYGLDPYEAEELQSLLSEDARSDFASGVIGFLAFLAITAAVAALIRELTKKI